MLAGELAKNEIILMDLRAEGMIQPGHPYPTPPEKCLGTFIVAGVVGRAYVSTYRRIPDRVLWTQAALGQIKSPGPVDR